MSLRARLERAHRGLDVRGGVLEDVRTERDLAEMPELGIARHRPGQRDPTTGVQHVDIPLAGAGLDQAGIHPQEMVGRSNLDVQVQEPQPPIVAGPGQGGHEQGGHAAAARRPSTN